MFAIISLVSAGMAFVDLPFLGWLAIRVGGLVGSLGIFWGLRYFGMPYGNF